MKKVSIGDSRGDVYFVYDGDCPICQTAARGLKIRKAVGNLHLIDARANKDNPVVKEVNEKGLNLDEGMVIKFNDVCYHGADALQIMALLGTNQGRFNRMNYLLFRSSVFAKICYPSMRGARNLAIRIKGVGKINNLIDKNISIFQPIFGKDWDRLPPVMHKHYANRPYCNDKSVVEGKLDVMCKWHLKPFLKLSGTVPAYNEKDVPVTVSFDSQTDSAAFCFNRVFHFDGKPFHFQTQMHQVNGNEVMEVMRYGICWHMFYGWDGEKVTLSHKGYSLRVFGINIALPITWLLGRGDAFEVPVDENSFDMSVSVTHPLFGKVYGYNGRFKVK